MPYPTTPATWVAGDVLTAAQLNAQLRDALLGAFPLGPPDVAWTAYTPTISQGATNNIAKTGGAAYTRVGRLVTVKMDLTLTGAGTAAQPVRVSLPITPSAANALPVGAGLLYDASLADNHSFLAILETTALFGMLATRVSGVLGTQQFTAALAASDVIRLTATYEAAT